MQKFVEFVLLTCVAILAVGLTVWTLKAMF